MIPRSLLAALLGVALSAQAAPLTKTILYVTQTPMPDEVLAPGHVIAQTRMNVASTMQSPLADTTHAARGGALWIRYSNGARVNLTAAAGFGGPVDANGNATGFQDASSIAVQRPAMHWSGTKAIFAMVLGGPASAGDPAQFRWQLYEIANFAQGQTPVISYVAGQPAAYNNFQACYDTQDRILFASDAPRGMQAHLYPQLDEYLSQPCNTGLWRLDRANANELKQIIHAPSGAFSPFIDSAGRVLFVQWDHLSRDTTATYDRAPIAANGDAWTQTFNGNGTFASEAANAAFTLGTAANYATDNGYPEPRNFDKTAFVGTNLNANPFNQFFPWECREDGSSHEVQNHVGRQEFGGAPARPSFNDDPNLVLLTFTHPVALHFLHLAESPVSAGTFFAVTPPEFGTHMAGPILTYQGGFGVNPDTMQVAYATPNVTVPNPALGQSPLANAVDLYRNPTPLSDGSLLAVHAAVKQHDSNAGADTAHPLSRYAFRLRPLVKSGGTFTPDLNAANAPTAPANVALSYFAGGSLVTYTGAPLWELDPVEVLARTPPAQLGSGIAAVEQGVFDAVGVHSPTFQNWLRAQNLALVANRDATRRDAADKQQPFNLKIATSATQTLGVGGKIYDIGWVQLFQAEGLRGYTNDGANVDALPAPGRRLQPVPLHDTATEAPLANMPATPGAPAGAVKLGDDGSWAALLPAGRAVSWHLLDGAGTKSQVKERYWVTFAPGEVRTCAACHGINTADQAGNLGAPTNPPAALATLLQFWKGNHPPGVVQHAAPAASFLKTAGTATLSVTRTAGSTGPASVQFSTADGTALAGADYTATNGTLTWPDGDTAPKTITVPLLNNAIIGPSKSFTVTLANPLYASLGAPTADTLTLTEPLFQAWKFLHFGTAANDPAIAGDLADPDGDGQPNGFEYVAGLVPTDPASLFHLRVERVPGQPTQMNLIFGPRFGDRTYIIEYRLSLTSGQWNPLDGTSFTDDADTRTVTDPTATDATRLYRVVITKP